MLFRSQAQQDKIKIDQCRDTKNNLEMAQKVAELLGETEKLVLAESCTGGEVCSIFAKIPGISDNLCGSFVTYRAASKIGWLGVDPRIVEEYSTESIECADEMSIKALKNTPEASWALAVVGHLGPEAPPDKDGKIFISVTKRTKKGNIKIKEQFETNLGIQDRISRQKAAACACLSVLARLLMKRESKVKPANDDSKSH